MPAPILASLDGDIMPADEAVIPVGDEGLLRGDGVFEVIRLYDGRPFALDEHMERMTHSARNLRLPFDAEAVRADIGRVLGAIAGAPGEHEQLRAFVTRGGRRVVLTEPMPKRGERVRLASVTFAPTRILDGVKSLSYAGNMLATRIAQEQDADEALLVTPHGRVLEAPTSTLFWARGDELLTPPLSDHILDSITRRVVLEVTDAREEVTTVDDLAGADEAFLASTTREVQSVSVIDGRDLGPAGPLTLAAAEGLRAYVERALAGGGA